MLPSQARALPRRRAASPTLPLVCAALLAAAVTAGAATSGGRTRHVISADIDPATHRLAVTDRVQVAARPADGVVDFVLSAALRITRSDPALREVPAGDVTFFGINGSGAEAARRVGVRRYRGTLPPGGTTLSVSYEGIVNFGLSDRKEEYTRGFRESAGILGPEGVYLAGSSYWYPTFDRDLLEFQLEVTAPAGWHVISQGNGTSGDGRGHARWESGGAMDEIDLVGGPLKVWRGAAGPVETLVYLHDQDDGLAGKYLAATAQYLEMYRQMIGPYPYGKFALVENFWETGYGMATFALLGREIVRFPFIINSSYPHEILHNWWGNSVFVDYESGNWCEGLTAYLADHLLQEQRGAGAEYRRSTLQKYRDFVRAGRDFPLTAFRSRESASTEAVGYGKALMMYHMLRLAVGDDTFRRSIARFYREFKGRRASFTDFEKTVEAASGRDFRRFFRDWVERSGAPELRVAVTAVRRDTGPGAPFVVEGTLSQVQGGEPFVVEVPVVVRAATGAARQVVRLASSSQSFSIRVGDVPVQLAVDPDFDVFRRLDPRETAPSIGQIFGEPRVLAVLPSAAGAAELEAWRELFRGWQGASHAVETELDTNVTELPADRAVWIAGRANRWAGRFLGTVPGLKVGESAVEVGGETMALASHTLVAVTRHPRNVEKAVGLLVVDPPAAFAGLGRKLPHYGKYSYLGFEGDEPVNVVKGQWHAADSPLLVDLRAPAGAGTPARASLGVRTRSALPAGAAAACPRSSGGRREGR